MEQNKKFLFYSILGLVGSYFSGNTPLLIYFVIILIRLNGKKIRIKWIQNFLGILFLNLGIIGTFSTIIVGYWSKILIGISFIIWGLFFINIFNIKTFSFIKRLSSKITNNHFWIFSIVEIIGIMLSVVSDYSLDQTLKIIIIICSLATALIIPYFYNYYDISKEVKNNG